MNKMSKNHLHRDRIHLTLPIAPNANHCLRTAAEGKRAQAMIPAEAVAWLDNLRAGGKEIPSIDLCGPGDVLASWPATRTCLELLQDKRQGAMLSLTTLGLHGAAHAAELKELAVDKVTILVDTVDRETAEKLYRWIRPDKKTLPLAQAVQVLIEDQARAVQVLTGTGLEVIVRTTVQQGINDASVPAIAEKMATLGATTMELTGEAANLEQLAGQASSHLRAVVVLAEPELPPPGTPKSGFTPEMPRPTRDRPNVAVASSNGMDVDLHLGQAGKLLIYGPRDDGLACLLETRATPPGGSPDRWKSLAATLPDCFALLASHAGVAPRQYLAEEGIRVILTEEQIEGMVDVLYGGGKKGKCKK